jgi:hypothetical protein
MAMNEFADPGQERPPGGKKLVPARPGGQEPPPDGQEPPLGPKPKLSPLDGVWRTDLGL